MNTCYVEEVFVTPTSTGLTSECTVRGIETKQLGKKFLEPLIANIRVCYLKSLELNTRSEGK